MPRIKNSDYPKQDKHEADQARFEVAITEETEQQANRKDGPSDQGKQNQCEKVVSVTVSHEAHTEQRTGNQGTAYESHPSVTPLRLRLMHSTSDAGSMRPRGKGAYQLPTAMKVIFTFPSAVNS